MKLWSTRPVPGMSGHALDAPIQTFQSTDLADAVNDVIWSPHNSTSFAAAMDDGRVELWDLKKKPLDPVVVHYPRGLQGNCRRTCVRFSTNSPVLISGDAHDCVDVMRMYNCEVEMFSEAEQQDRLISHAEETVVRGRRAWKLAQRHSHPCTSADAFLAR